MAKTISMGGIVARTSPFKKVKLISPISTAIQVKDDAENQELIAEYYGGSVRGTRLQPIDRVIQFHDMAGDEIRAAVGDWILANDLGGITVISDVAYKKCYVEHA